MWDKFLAMLTPSTVRGLIIAVGTIAGIAIPDAKLEAIMVIVGVLLTVNEVFRTQYDTEELNKEE